MPCRIRFPAPATARPRTPTVFDNPLQRYLRAAAQSSFTACAEHLQPLASDIHADAQAHRARHRHLLQVNPLGARGLGLVQRLHQRLQVLAQRLRRRTKRGRSCTARCRPCRRGTAPGRALAFFTASATSGVTVPTFGFGIRPRGPRIWPSWPTTRIASGAGDHARRIPCLPPLICSARSSMPTMSAPAALAACGLVALREHRHAHRLAGAARQHHRAAHRLVRLLRVDAEVDRDVDRFVELGGRGLLHQLHRVERRIGLRAVDLARASPSCAWRSCAMFTRPPRRRPC